MHEIFNSNYFYYAYETVKVSTYKGMEEVQSKTDFLYVIIYKIWYFTIHFKMSLEYITFIESAIMILWNELWIRYEIY